MKQRQLGRTGIRVSELAFGGVEIGMPYGLGVTSQDDMLSEQAAIDLLRTAVDTGINFFDTARLYGRSETLMGKAFLGNRKAVVIGTKCPPLRDLSGNLPNTATTRQLIEQALNESLKALQTDYVDIYMLHHADPDLLRHDDIAQIFAEIKASGRIRSTGVSTYSTEDTRLAIESGAWDVIQLPFNLMDQRQSDLFAKAAQQGVGLVIRSILMKGLLTSRPYALHPALQAVEEHITQYQSLLNNTMPDLSTLAIRFGLSSDEVSAILVGIDRLDYLHQSIRAANGSALPAPVLQQARQLAYPDPPFIDLPHWDRMGWLT